MISVTDTSARLAPARVHSSAFKARGTPVFLRGYFYRYERQQANLLRRLHRADELSLLEEAQTQPGRVQPAEPTARSIPESAGSLDENNSGQPAGLTGSAAATAMYA